MYKPYQPKQRTFVIFPEPHVADPAWIQPVMEIGPDGKSVGYSDTSELRRFIAEVDLHIAELAERQEVLELFGISWNDYMQKVIEKRATAKP